MSTIDDLSKKIQYDVARLASFKKVEDILPEEPDAQVVRISTTTLNGSERQILLARNLFDEWVRVGGTTAYTWDKIRSMYLIGGELVTKIELAEWSAAWDLKED